MISPLAHQPHPLKTAYNRKSLLRRSRPVWGLCVHTTGSSIVAKAIKVGADPLEYTTSYYLKPDSFFPHYVCSWDGTIVAICDEDRVAYHVGMTSDERKAFSSGTWQGKINARFWLDAWPLKDSPNDLYPGTSPNQAYIGLELLPLPLSVDGLYFTPEQHQAVAYLAADIFARHALIYQRGRVCGHEDVNPLSRSDKGGGWDPGARRMKPRFDWDAVLPFIGG